MKILKVIVLLALICVLGSCKKFLNEKPKQSLYTPDTAEDLQALLNNSNLMNLRSYGDAYIEVVSDDYYVSNSSWQNADIDQQHTYIWDYKANFGWDSWRIPYAQVIYTSNLVLDRIPLIPIKNNSVALDGIEGEALFFRACAFYQLAQLYCKPYSSTASTDLGIVLRQTTSMETKSIRATVEETYRKIIDDLKKAAEKLMLKSGYVTRPSKIASYAMLARVYLSMRDYENALNFANMSLSLESKLLDFNDLLLTGNPILPVFTNNPEILFFSSLSFSSIVGRTVAKIDSNLYKSYNPKDLRKNVFFLGNTGASAGTYRFNGSYLARADIFTGLTTAELFLIKAECLARKGSVNEAIASLNVLLKARFNKNDFVPVSVSNADEAKKIILQERRKELIFRGQRWSDLRRLNLEDENITLKRVIGEVTYSLQPNSTRWVMPIPQEEIDRSGIIQNPN